MDEPWREKAACFGSFSESFFPDSYGGRAAKIVCDTCIVTAECLDYAMQIDAPFGVWGGLTRSQRLKLKRRAKKTQSSSLPSTAKKAC